MALNDLLSQGPSMVGVFLMAAAALYLFGAFIVGFLRDRREEAMERSYVPPSERPGGPAW